MRMRLAFFAAFLLISASAMAAPYYVPPEQITASMQITKSGTAITGKFDNATGAFNYDAAASTLSNLRVALDGATLVSPTGELEQMLEAPNYPMSFVALPNTVLPNGKGSVKGTLMLHGKSKPVTLDAIVSGSGKSVSLSLHGDFKRVDFGIFTDLEAPGVYGDTITMQIDMQAIRQ